MLSKQKNAILSKSLLNFFINNSNKVIKSERPKETIKEITIEIKNNHQELINKDIRKRNGREKKNDIKTKPQLFEFLDSLSFKISKKKKKILKIKNNKNKTLSKTKYFLPFFDF